MSKVKLSADAAERALCELIANGARISQHAIEKRAGLANGALNYNHPLYVSLKQKIQKAKATMVSTNDNGSPELQKRIKREIGLKRKYRKQRDSYKAQLKQAEGEKLELAYQLHHLQRYLKHLERHGLADVNVLEFAVKNRS
ncbi:hypothetical protein ACFSJ3_15720 [Corallincola platygyrae]|uniref:Transposase n=1 Tax=Corallincola platygyrae TaxID=1193278 RepID=A0ABW4XPF4_9GAMM